MPALGLNTMEMTMLVQCIQVKNSSDEKKNFYSTMIKAYQNIHSSDEKKNFYSTMIKAYQNILRVLF